MPRLLLTVVLIAAAVGCGESDAPTAGAPPRVTPVTANLVGANSVSADSVGASPVITGGAATVAVIDLDRVAEQLGRDKQMQQQVEHAKASLNTQLESVRTTLLGKYQEQKAAVDQRSAADPTQQSSLTAKLKALDQQLGKQLTDTQKQAKAKLLEYRQATIQQFRQEVRAVAREVAAESGALVVLTKNDAVVFCYEPAADITQAVIERMQAAGQARVAAEPGATTVR